MLQAQDIAAMGAAMPGYEPVTLYARNRDSSLGTSIAIPFARREPAKSDMYLDLGVSADTKIITFTIYDQNLAYFNTPSQPQSNMVVQDQFNTWWEIKKCDIYGMNTFYYCVCIWQPPSTSTPTP